MATHITCDGCGKPLLPIEVEITGKRSDGVGGLAMPGGKFHLCMSCGAIGFHAMATRPAVTYGQAVDLAAEANEARRSAS